MDHTVLHASTPCPPFSSSYALLNIINKYEIKLKRKITNKKYLKEAAIFQ